MADTFTISAETSKSAADIVRALNHRAGWTSNECSGDYHREATGGQANLSWDVDNQGTRLELTLPVGVPEVFGREFENEWCYLSDSLACDWRAPNRSSPLDAWRQANRQSVQSTKKTYHVIDAERRREAWRWNNQREINQSQIGEAIFAPRIVFFAQSNAEPPRRARRGIVWPDAIPIAVPEVELIALTVPDDTRFSAPPGPYLLEASAVLNRLRSEDEDLVAVHTSPVEHRQFVWEAAPYELISELAQAGESAADTSWEGVSATSVVEEDLLDEASLA